MTPAEFVATYRCTIMCISEITKKAVDCLIQWVETGKWGTTEEDDEEE